MIICKDWFTFLISANFALSVSAFSFSFNLDKQSIQVGEITSLRLEVPLTKQSERPLVFDELLTQHKKLKVLEQQAQKIERVYQIIFEITAYEPNEYLIPPVQVKLGADTFSTEAIPLSVTTSRQKDDVEIRPEFESLEKPFPWRKVYSALMWLLSGSFVFWLMRWAISRVSWRNFLFISRFFKLPSFESRKTWLRKEIKRLKTRLALESDTNAILDDTFFVLKKYFEKCFHQPIPSWTSQELQVRLHDFLSKRRLSKLCSEVAFLQYQTPNRNPTPDKITELIQTMEKELL